ncbi:MAG: phosphoglucomutase [Spirochaetae bacterium HGW-Spirochaetae-8]|nr:MAG: phosphoglucomutase [Spirochaetae bacterium HGW-Spirochaetae-8]
MVVTDSRTGFFIADTTVDPLQGLLPTNQELQQSFSSFIISASGWRKVFAASKHEEDRTEALDRADSFLVAFAALAMARHLGAGTTVLVGLDARPTGASIADISNRIFLSNGIAVRYLFIAAAPEIMAYSNREGIDAFFYISASHNPIGHNGFKFGRKGGVFTGQETASVSSVFKSLVEKADSCELVQQMSHSVKQQDYEQVLHAIAQEKEQAMLAYENLVLRTAADSRDEEAIGAMLATIKHSIEKHPLGIVGELNGSARGETIDRTFLSALGVRTLFLNDRPRQVVHPIVPEGENLELCRTELEKAFAADPAYQLGYVPDNDGDRGNIVYIQQSTGRAHILGAQELFALVASVELTLARAKHHNLAIAINGPTSLIIESIATRLGAVVARAEVGEANVVQLADQLRDKGYTVRLLGEGSNGGNITHPSKVRDPLNTLVSLIKLLTSETLFAEVTNQDVSPGASLSVENAVASLPKRTITEGFSLEAIMRIKSASHLKLKTAYEKLFAADFSVRAQELRERFGIVAWREEQLEGTVCRTGVGEDFRTGAGRGGLKILFLNQDGEATDFIWMRGSGTEPVFRILADAIGDDQARHDYLLAWQRSLVERADAEACLL